jgi:hypothetical protein
MRGCNCSSASTGRVRKRSSNSDNGRFKGGPPRRYGDDCDCPPQMDRPPPMPRVQPSTESLKKPGFFRVPCRVPCHAPCGLADVCVAPSEFLFSEKTSAPLSGEYFDCATHSTEATRMNYFIAGSRWSRRRGYRPR